MLNYKHSVTLDISKCKGCTNCIKRCPTEAIRVRGGKATIKSERCIDCGECIRVCPNNAKKAMCSKFEHYQDYKWKIALPAPSLYGQFDNLDDVDYVLDGLLKIGFDDVFEVSAAAELVSAYTRAYLKEKNYDIHLITNGFLEVQSVKMEASGLDKMIDKSFVSEVVGFKKPDHRIFYHAMEKVNASLEECVMIGDDLSVDIIPAKEIGMTHIYFNRKKISHNEKLDYEIYDLIEISDII